MSLPSVTLWNHQGTSDKIYKLAIEESGGGYVVNFAYGRRGSTLRTGTKTQQPVDLATATKTYEKVLRGQLPPNDQYEIIEGDGGGLGASVVKDVEQRDTGLYPQLLVPIEEAEAERYILDDAWGMQEKFDGKRITLRKDASGLVAANKKGLSVGFPDAYAEAAKRFEDNFTIDGESIGDVFYAFDLLDAARDVRGETYRTRYNMLDAMGGNFGKAIVVAPLAVGQAAKRAMFARLKAEGKEGAVFKKLNAPWSSGRPESGGPALKCKFWSACSCVVAKVNAKRSVQLSMEGQNIGNVTIPPNKAVPKAGQVVEIRYLYVQGRGGSLYQPIYLGVRDDVDPHECTFDQQKLKYKAENDEE